MLDNFKYKMEQEGKSQNTIKSYLLHAKKYIRWYEESFGMQFKELYRENILDFKSYLINVENLKGKSINAILSSLVKLNKCLIENEVQQEMVIYKNDKIKIQENVSSLSIISKQEVEEFRQRILENDGKQMYAITTLLAYTGVRISECLSIKVTDFNLQTKELVIRGKGGKERIVFLNDKVLNSLKEFLKEREDKSEYLFYSSHDYKINRTTVNRVFNKYSNKITPHLLRHFFCSNAIESGFSLHQVAYLAGHSSLSTVLIYANPSREDMKNMMNHL